MIFEIQRIAVICLFFYVYIHAQDVQNVGVNLQVKDLFANPEVDPFANMMSGSSATSKDKAKTSTNSQLTITRTIVKTGRETERTQRKPVVDGGNLKTTKVATSTLVKKSGDSGVSGTRATIKSPGSTSRSTSVTSRSSTIGTSGGTGSASTTVTRGGSGRASTTVTRGGSGSASTTVTRGGSGRTTRIGTTGGSGRTTTRKMLDADNSGTRTAGTRTVTRKTSVTTTKGPNSTGRRTTKTPAVHTSRGASGTRKTVVRKTSASARRGVIDTNRGQSRGTSGSSKSGTQSKGTSESSKSGTQSSTTTTTVTRKAVGGSGTASSTGITTRGKVGTSGSSTKRTNVSRGRVTGDGTVSSGTVRKTTTVTRTTSSRGSGSAQANNAKFNKSARPSTAGSNLAGSNTVRETRFGSTSTGDSNTRTSSNVERMSTGSNTEMNTVETVAVEPIMYIRTLYRDQRICENCIGDGTDCYLEHPDECRKYIRCSASSVGAGMEALEMNCAFGTFWSNVANTCDLASDVFCEKDACRDTRLKAYPSGINCRSYWRCVNGRSYAECCPHGEAYMDGICVPSESCKVDDGECPFRFRNSGDSLTDKEAIEAKQECQLEKVPGDIISFKMKNHWAKMKCADATRFDENKCTCVPHVFSAVQCKPIADLEFSTYDVENKVRNYIHANNVTNSQGYGLFNGRASVSVPYFKNNQNIGTHFVIRMRFYHDGKQGYDSQVLASNCKTRTGRELSPSFAILLAKTKRQIIFFASTKREDRKRYGATASLSLPFQPEKWTIVELQFLGEVLFAKVETLEADGTSNVTKDEKVLKGTLPTSVMPLMVGNCNMNDGFVGYIDQVKTYVCDPHQA